MSCIKKLTVSFLLFFMLQGCSLTLPKQETIKVPGHITSPSILIKREQYISVLEMDGKVTDLAKVSGSPSYLTYKTNSKFYFLIESNLASSSMWVFDRTTKTLLCLIPKIKATSGMMDFIITSDEHYMLYTTSLPLNGEFADKHYDQIFSFQDKKNLEIPVSKEETVIDLKKTTNQDEFLILTQNKKTKNSKQKTVYFWNAVKKSSKTVALFASDEYKFSQDYKWLAVLENETLVRYSLEDGKKEILKKDVSDCQFDLVGDNPLLLFRDDRLSSPVVSYMKADKTWNYMTFANPYDKCTIFENRGASGVIFKTKNDITRTYKLIHWDPNQNKTNILFVSKLIDMTFDQVSEGGDYLVYKGTDSSTGPFTFAIYNRMDGMVREFSNRMDYVYPASNDESKWIFGKDATSDKGKENAYIVYDWNQNQKFTLTMPRDAFSIQTTNDGKLIVYKSSLINVQTGKEIPLPNVGDFESITWLE